MQRPKMILFDYGHTLALEPVQDYLRGHRRVIELASANPLGVTGEEFANGLLRAEKVAVVPGDAFGDAGKFHVRCSYATSMKNLDEATFRIGRYVQQLRADTKKA